MVLKIMITFMIKSLTEMNMFWVMICLLRKCYGIKRRWWPWK